MSKQPTKRTYSRLPRAQREKDILEAARLEFSKNGYEGTMVSVIASKAGVVEGTIYKYFHNKRDLLVRVIEKWYERMIKDNTAQLSARAGMRSRIHYIIFQHLSAILAEPDLCRLVLSELRNASGYRNTNIADWNRRYTEVTLVVLTQGIEDGECRDGVSVKFIRDMIFGTMEHATWTFLNGGGDFSPAEMAEDVTDMVYRAIAKTPDNKSQPAELFTGLTRLGNVAARLEEVAAQLERKT
ncbi:MAG: TetR/AcrR family transcriptional regulator [Sneathiella sp.]